MIACFFGNISAKYYKNLSMLSRVIAKNVGDVFLRHGVVHAAGLGFFPGMRNLGSLRLPSSDP